MLIYSMMVRPRRSLSVLDYPHLFSPMEWGRPRWNGEGSGWWGPPRVPWKLESLKGHAVSSQTNIQFKTVVYLLLGIIIPVWPISLPFFWYLAYRSTQVGGAPTQAALGTVGELERAQRLRETGAISQDEFERIKSDLIGGRRAG